MKLIVKLKNTHLILLFLSLCIFFPISIANNETLAKNNNSKGFANSNYETREFTNTNDNENNKKFIFVASSKEGNSFKYDNHTNNKFDDLNKKIPENPVSVQNQVPKKSNYNTVFDEKKIVDLIQNVIRNNEKNNIRTEKSKIIEDLKILNHPKSLNSILTESSIKNLDKEILTDLISHENLLKSKNYILILPNNIFIFKNKLDQYNKKEIPSEFDNLLSNDHSMYSQTNDISQLPQSYIKNKPFVDIVQQNPTNSQMNFNSHYKGDYLKNENHNDSTSNKIMSHNKITKYLYKQNPVNDYQYINRIPSEDEGIKEIYALPKNNIYIKQIPSNTQEINNYNLNSDFENHSPLSKRFLGQDCPCEKLIRCRPCEFNMVNSLGKFLAENPLNIITDKDCPCARKKICPPCAPASVIHDIALRKVKYNFNYNN